MHCKRSELQAERRSLFWPIWPNICHFLHNFSSSTWQTQRRAWEPKDRQMVFEGDVERRIGTQVCNAINLELPQPRICSQEGCQRTRCEQEDNGVVQKPCRTAAPACTKRRIGKHCSMVKMTHAGIPHLCSDQPVGFPSDPDGGRETLGRPW